MRQKIHVNLQLMQDCPFKARRPLDRSHAAMLPQSDPSESRHLLWTIFSGLGARAGVCRTLDRGLDGQERGHTLPRGDKGERKGVPLVLRDFSTQGDPFWAATRAAGQRRPLQTQNTRLPLRSSALPTRKEGNKEAWAVGCPKGQVTDLKASRKAVPQNVRARGNLCPDLGPENLMLQTSGRKRVLAGNLIIEGIDSNLPNTGSASQMAAALSPPSFP